MEKLVNHETSDCSPWEWNLKPVSLPQKCPVQRVLVFEYVVELLLELGSASVRNWNV
jgi:hypothetical protein